MLLLILTVLFRMKTVELLLLRTPCYSFQLLFLNMTTLTSFSQVDSLYLHSFTFTKAKVCECKSQSAKMGCYSKEGNYDSAQAKQNKLVPRGNTSVPLGLGFWLCFAKFDRNTVIQESYLSKFLSLVTSFLIWWS